MTLKPSLPARAPNAGEIEVARFIANAEKLEAAHAYSPEQEHDACGVGLVAAIDGKPRREVVARGDRGAESGVASRRRRRRRQDRRRRRHPCRRSRRISSRGQVERDRPQAAARAASRVGKIFLPRTDLGAQETLPHDRRIRDPQFRLSDLYGWRQVPIDIVDHRREGQRHAARDRADHVRTARRRSTREAFERELYCDPPAHREARAIAAQIQDFYICSLSSPLDHLQGHVPGRAAFEFLSRPAGRALRLAPSRSIHQRYSTNTFPTWRLAQPFRMLAHNGEINTLSGNINWMKSHETRHGVASSFGEHGDDIKPVIQPGGSDYGALDAVFEVLVRAGRDAPMAKALLIPEASVEDADDAAGASRHVCLLQRGDGAVGRPGGDRRHRRALGDRRHGPQRPAAACATRITDRRPARSSARKPAWCVLDEATIVRQGPRRPRPDDRASISTRARFYDDREIKDMLAARTALRRMDQAHHRSSTTSSRPTRPSRALFDERDAAPPPGRRRLHAGGARADPPSDGGGRQGSRRLDGRRHAARRAVRAAIAACTIIFRQNFSQVTNPPID